MKATHSTSAGDNRVRIITDDGAEVRSIANIPDYMQADVSAPNGSTIVGGGEDSLLRLWDAAGKELAAFNKRTQKYYMESSAFAIHDSISRRLLGSLNFDRVDSWTATLRDKFDYQFVAHGNGWYIEYHWLEFI